MRRSFVCFAHRLLLLLPSPLSDAPSRPGFSARSVLAAGQVHLEDMLLLFLFAGEGADDDGVVDAQLRGDLGAVVAIEDVAVFVLLDGHKDTSGLDVGRQGVALLGGKRRQELILRRLVVHDSLLSCASPAPLSAPHVPCSRRASPRRSRRGRGGTGVPAVRTSFAPSFAAPPSPAGRRRGGALVGIG